MVGEIPEQIYIFKTETGSVPVFFCIVEEIPPQVRNVVDTGGKAKAEVGTEPDDEGLIEFKRFIV